ALPALLGAVVEYVVAPERRERRRRFSLGCRRLSGAAHAPRGLCVCRIRSHRGTDPLRPPRAGSRRPGQPDPLMIVCLCRGVSERHIEATVAAGATTVGDVSRACGAATDCGAWPSPVG